MHPTTQRHPRAASGFTLIELMITVAIVAILVAIAVGSYDFATVKTRRAAAKACLTEGAQFMERYYTIHFSYEDAVLPACSADVTDFYTVGFDAAPDAGSFKIQAVPQGAQANSDTRCGTLWLNQTGQKGATDVDACW
jgi:type IV pilus assembly protein PilE